MKAVVHERFGGPEQLRLCELPRPEPGEGELRVRVHAVSLNGADAEMLTGTPAYGRLTAGGLLRPRRRPMGSDVAGVVESVGPGVEGFQVGDAVLGEVFEHFGGLAEYVCAPAKLWIHIPDGLGFVEASTLPQAGVLALQGIRDTVPLGPDSQVLIVGAGGGVGVFAVQLAKRLGATVTAVDNGSKSALLRDLGADRVVDHTREDVLADGQTYDLVLDAVAAHAPSAYRRALKPDGACSLVGGGVGRLLWTVLYGAVLRMFSRKRIGLLMWDRDPSRVETIVSLVASGEIRAVIDGVHPLEQSAEAFRRLTDRVAQGKVVVQVRDDPEARSEPSEAAARSR